MTKRFNHLDAQPLPGISEVYVDGKRFYECGNNNIYPSVTSFLGSLPNPSLDAWKKRVGPEESQRIAKKAATSGSIIHEMTEMYLCNNNYDDIRKKFVGRFETIMFTHLMSELNKINNILYIEAPLYSDTMKLAGRTDCIAVYDGVASIIDFKTSKTDKDEKYIKNYFYQTTLYSLMLQELTGIRVYQLVIIILCMDGSVQVFKKNRAEFFPELKKLVKTHVREFGKL